jgi:quinol monooxygenase YgiN
VSTLLAHVKIKHGLEDHWEGIAQRVFSATHDNEEGCVRYEYWRGSEPRTYYVLLSFQSFDDFMTHQVADYHHNTDFRDCFEDFNLEWVDPIENASPLIQSETSGETKEDRGEVWNNYVRNHSSEIPAWWLKQRD